MLILILVSAGLILWPLLRPPQESVPQGPSSAEAERAKRMALYALRELEMEFATGKLSAEDYARLRERYEARAAQALGLVPARPSPSLDEEIRAARARRRCPACGQRRPPGARFCPACGRPVEGGAG
ncbi:MAG: zinc-ribbon domain-containing protein [Armatimonadota bacterium]|nr:zinc-ribbon domain-containing protein [Armatimonadota bacterium]MDR7510019.1 zinc-ribbon domain-containing protein [Armatimonadota bacterium]